MKSQNKNEGNKMKHLNRYKEVKQNIQLTSVANNKEWKSLVRSEEKREKKKSINSKTKEEPFDYRWLYTEI